MHTYTHTDRTNCKRVVFKATQVYLKFLKFLERVLGKARHGHIENFRNLQATVSFYLTNRQLLKSSGDG